MAKYDPDDTALRIVNATLELIGEQGTDALRTREILARAGVSNQSAVSYYFGSLGALKRVALERFFDGARAVLEGLEELPDARAALLEFCRRMARFILDHPALERNIVALALTGDPSASVFSRVMEEILLLLARLIERVRADGDEQGANQTAVALASATIYPLLMAGYAPPALGGSALEENQREAYFANLIQRLV